MTIYVLIGILLASLTILTLWRLGKKKKEIPEPVPDSALMPIVPSTLRDFDSSDWAKAQEVQNQTDYKTLSGNTLLSSELQEVVSKILVIPKDYHAFDKSKFQLVMESGYLERHEQITEKVLSTALAAQPHHINEWLQYSQDQRISEGYFLRKDTDNYCLVKVTTKGGYKEALTTYPDPKSACAAFIKREIEFSRELAEADKQKKNRKKINSQK